MIVGYVRVSTDKQHPENQKDEITRYAFSEHRGSVGIANIALKAGLQ